MILGIVGSEGAKFTPETEAKAKAIIRGLLLDPRVTGVSSGHCHLGGVDIWAEEIGAELKLQLLIFPPSSYAWGTGYKPRNKKIARVSDELHCITVATLPDNFKGMRFERCYHCDSATHVKSGGCWTKKFAESLGKVGVLHVIR